MTWGAVVDLRRLITAFFLTMLLMVLATFFAILVLAGVEVLVANPAEPFFSAALLALL